MAEAARRPQEDRPSIDYYPDMVPAQISAPARRLIAASAKAFVFAGMGSWNDVGFAERAVQVEYQAVTERLRQASGAWPQARISRTQCERNQSESKGHKSHRNLPPGTRNGAILNRVRPNPLGRPYRGRGGLEATRFLSKFCLINYYPQGVGVDP